MVIPLSVSRSIIESHHGRLRAARNDGPGATLSLSTPRICHDVTGGTPTALSHRAMTAMNGTRPIVAVVDDDESVRESLPDLSKEFGFEVRVGRGVPRVGLHQPNEVSDSRHRHDGHVGTRSATRSDASPVRRSDRLHHGAWGRRRPCARAQPGAVECLLTPSSETALLAALDAALG